MYLFLVPQRKLQFVAVIFFVPSVPPIKLQIQTFSNPSNEMFSTPQKRGKLIEMLSGFTLSEEVLLIESWRLEKSVDITDCDQ